MALETMESWLALGLSNAVLATALALLAFAVSKLWKRPPVAHVLWLLVLLKLISPALLEIPASSATHLRTLATQITSTLGTADDSSLAADPGLPLEAEKFVAMEPPGAADAVDDASMESSIDESEPLVAMAESGTPAASGLSVAPDSWLVPAVLIVWLSGALVVLGAAAVRILRFDRLLRWSRPASVELTAIVGQVAHQLGLRAPPRAFVVDARIPPLLWAWGGNTRVIFPAGLVTLLSEAQTRTLVAHELAHLRRRDHWLRWLELLALALYWWLPVAWLARRQLRRAEEECCDAWVQRELSASVRDYARALLKTIDFLSGVQVKLPRTASTLGEARFLRRRFEMILERSLEHRLSAPLRVLWFAACLAILPWAASGALGQKADEEPVKDPPPVAIEAKNEIAPPPAEASKDFEHRLSRMEGQLAELMAEIRSMRGKGPGKEKPSLRILDGAIESVDPKSGKALWKTALKGAPHVEVHQDPDKVVITDTKKHKTVVLDADTGKIITEDYEGDEPGIDAILENANAKLRAEKKRQADEQHRKAKESEYEAKEAAQRGYKEALKVKTDIARLQAEREKLMAQLKKLEEQRAAIKDQIKKLESKSNFEQYK